jgi:hypothetical protein
MFDPEAEEWHRLPSARRWKESLRLWKTFILLGGSLEPMPGNLKCGANSEF